MNVVAGDPDYALDCREDEYAWCNVTPDGRLVPSAKFERIREGLDDYRRLITLGQRNHDALFGPDDGNVFWENFWAPNYPNYVLNRGG